MVRPIASAALLLVLAAGFSPALAANPVADLYGKQMDLLESDLVSLAKAMPADRYDFRPSGGEFTGVRTFGEQIRHVATMLYMTAAIVLRQQSPYGPGVNDNGPSTIQGKEQALDYLAKAIAYSRQAIASLDEHNQFEQLQTYFGSQSRVEVAAGLIYHSYDHYGQLVVYARLNGIVPPASRR